MSVGKRVSDTIDKMGAGDAEGALFQICAAIDVTAKKEFGKSGRQSYKDFIHQNLRLITDIGFNGKQILNIHLAFDHPDLKKDANGVVAIQDILYHAVRCGLYHDAALPANLKFIKECKICVEHDMLCLPASLVYGLLTAVVTAPVNAGEHATKPATLNIGDFPILIDKLWGRRNELLWLLDATNELAEMNRTAKESMDAEKLARGDGSVIVEPT